jgi:hypothetical protein
MGNAFKLIEGMLSKMYSKSTVIELSQENVSEYKKGKVQGRIETLNEIHRILTQKEQQDNGKD